MVEVRWKVLCGRGMETFLNGCSLTSNMEARAALVICDVLLKLSPALMSFALRLPHSSGSIGSLEPWVLALHVTAPERLMMSLLVVRGPRDVSLSSCLLTDQY